MPAKYTEEKNVLMLMSLMKQHGVRKIVASPGTTNISFVVSLQRDPYFQVFSSVDERSAAYIACGLAEESGEPVALSCTQATASRNFFPGLTEAYYRKLPVLAVTSTQHAVRIGQNIQQAIDRTVQPIDTVKLSVQVPIIQSAEDATYANVAINRALLELRRDGGAPVHINLTTTYTKVYDAPELPKSRSIMRYTSEDELPQIPSGSRVAVYVGAHSRWSDRLTVAVDSFCETYGACVLCDQTSNYWGRYRVNPSLLFSQGNAVASSETIDVLIHIGNTSGGAAPRRLKASWRVNPDGEVRDTFGCLKNVFDMSEERFFETYASMVDSTTSPAYREECAREATAIMTKIPELPFSNAWMAQQTLPLFPEGSIIHMGIYNSLRTWSLFEGNRVRGYCNTGGFGIDGGVSSLLGASLATDAPCFGVFGDLAFFYDMNALGNRHVGNNLRILIVNNGCGVEFKNHINRAYPLGDEADLYVSARGHYGHQSRKLIKHFAEDLGFEYRGVETKDEYLVAVDLLVSPEPRDRPVLIEAFVRPEDDTDALKILYSIEETATGNAKAAIKSVIGEKGIRMLKGLVR